MVRYLCFAFLACVTLTTKTSASEFQICVEFLESKSPGDIIIFEQLPKDAKVLGSLMVFAELGKCSIASARIGKQNLELSAQVQKVEEDEVTVELELGYAVGRIPEQDRWKTRTTTKVKLGKSCGTWAGSANAICNGYFVTITRKTDVKEEIPGPKASGFVFPSRKNHQ